MKSKKEGVPVAYLRPTNVSKRAKNILNRARELAGHEEGSHIVTPRSLLAAILEPGGRTLVNASDAWLLTRLRTDWTKWIELRTQYYPHLDEEAGGSCAVSASFDAAVVLQLASTLAIATSADPKVRARHLIGALLIYDAPTSASAHSLIRELGCEPVDLRRSLLEALPSWNIPDNMAAWEWWLMLRNPEKSEQEKEKARSVGRTQYLSLETIRELHDTAVRIGLANERTALLSSLIPGYVATLPEAPTLDGQVLNDLQMMNQVDHLNDGTIPLVEWLRNARHLARTKIESRVFEQALDKLPRR